MEQARPSSTACGPWPVEGLSSPTQDLRLVSPDFGGSSPYEEPHHRARYQIDPDESPRHNERAIATAQPERRAQTHRHRPRQSNASRTADRYATQASAHGSATNCGLGLGRLAAGVVGLLTSESRCRRKKNAAVLRPEVAARHPAPAASKTARFTDRLFTSRTLFLGGSPRPAVEKSMGTRASASTGSFLLLNARAG